MTSNRTTRVIDRAKILTAQERLRLQRFVREACFSRVKDRGWVKHILIRDMTASDPPDCAGFWVARLQRNGAWLEKYEAVIVINAQLKDVAEMELVLAHEYGHHWSMSYMVNTWEVIKDWGADRAPWLYYRIRELDPKKYVCDYSQGWEFCDKEVLAEDYRCLLTPQNEDHAMQSDIGLPGSEVRTYLERLGRPIWER